MGHLKGRWDAAYWSVRMGPLANPILRFSGRAVPCAGIQVRENLHQVDWRSWRNCGSQKQWQDVPGGPVTMTLCFQYGRCGFSAYLGN